MAWPEPLISEIAERRCIIFFGSGASAGSTDPNGNRPPTWGALLEEARDRFLDAPDHPLATELLTQRRYLEAAEIIFSNADTAERNAFIRERFRDPPYEPSRMHELIRDLDPKVAITTNYDQIYERLCPTHMGYVHCRHHDDNLLNEIRSRNRLVVKAHGCVSDPGKIVLLRSHYFDIRANYPRFYNVLDSLFLTSTILFLGCSLDDPDIQLVLENANIAMPCEHPHYALVQEGQRHPALVAAARKAYNLRLIEYANPAGDHAEAITALEELLADVLAYRKTRSGS